jgi:hypothetical protein
MTERDFFDANRLEILKVFDFRFNSAVGIAKKLQLKSFSPKRYFDTENPQETTVKPLLCATITQFQEDFKRYNEVMTIISKIVEQYKELS